MQAPSTSAATLPDGPDILTRYRLGRAQWINAAAAEDRWNLWLANTRLAIFAAALLYAWAAWHGWPWWGLSAFALAFGGAAIAHAIVLRALRTARHNIEVFDEALARGAGAWPGCGRGGEGLAPAHHPCAEDLDLFGPGSLFELLNTCRTRIGEERLAATLLHGADHAQAIARAQAVQEMSRSHALRIAMAAAGRPERVDAPAAFFASWGATPPQFPGQGWRVWCAVNTLILTVALLIAALTGFYAPLLALFTVNLVLLGLFKGRVSALQGWAEASERHWSLLGEAIQHLEQSEFTAPLLVQLRGQVRQPVRASEAFRRLDRLVWMLQMPANQFFMPIAIVSLWPVLFGLAVERWRRTFGPHFEEWLAALAEFEALCALGTFAFEHPDFAYPEWSEETVYEATALAHPLLPEKVRVANDVFLGDSLRLLVVSGSNMSGKSTLMRSIGINAVLAMAGAPVCARRLRLSPLAIGATMRVHDSIQEGASRFYAEVLRLKQLLDLARGERPLLFLCDEILHGTNSHDRAEGARAVMRAFQEAGAIGVLSTHDLALTTMAAELGGAANVHLQDEFDGEKIVFDYTLRPGVVQKSNALALMRGAGLPV